jgi:hypothetical protein
MGGAAAFAAIAAGEFKATSSSQLDRATGAGPEVAMTSTPA